MRRVQELALEPDVSGDAVRRRLPEYRAREMTWRMAASSMRQSAHLGSATSLAQISGARSPCARSSRMR